MRKLSDYLPEMKGDDPVRIDVPVDLGEIVDVNGNEAIEIDAVASAVNHLRVANAAASSGPTLSSAGDDTNVDINIAPKGSGGVNLTSTDTAALAVGANGATNPVLQVDAGTASVATGLKVTGAAAASGVALDVVSSGTNENLTIDAKGSGTISLNTTGTGTVVARRALAAWVASTSAFTAGRNGSTNPALQVDTNTASSATGIKITAAAAAGGVAVAAISSGSNENLTIDSKGTGTITFQTGTAVPAGGAAAAAVRIGTSGPGVFVGSGAPTVTAPQGSLYLRTDGSSTSTRAYINTDSGTTWTAITTAA